MRNALLLLAAGKSSRFLKCSVASAMVPTKIYSQLPDSDFSVLSKVVHSFHGYSGIELICIVIDPLHYELCTSVIHEFSNVVLVTGGDTRKNSVFCGLKFLESYNPQNVLIHDAARPFVSSDVIGRVLTKLEECDAVDVLIPVVDTLKILENATLRTVSRDNLYQTQTPQGFKFKLIYDLHKKSEDLEFSDDISLCIAHGLNVGYVMGEPANYKITFQTDL